jgi:hypothetical protein
VVALSMELIKQYHKVINKQDIREEEVHQFLVDHPLLLPLYCPLENIVFSKLKLGNQFVVDFAFARMNSPGITWNFIEIEKPQDTQFNASGDPTAELTHGLRQITDWSVWLTENRDFFVKNYPFKNETQKYGLYERPNFTLIIGRRENIADKNRARYRHMSYDPFVEIMSFDRLKDNLKYQYFDHQMPVKVCSFVNGDINVLKEITFPKNIEQAY